MLNRILARSLLATLLCIYPVAYLMAEQDSFIIDDRTTGDKVSSSGKQWRFVSDGVMGGVSAGRLEPAVAENRPCLQLQGKVRLDNNGGFIQAALDVSDEVLDVVADYTGVMLEVSGNGEAYNLHLRTRDLWLPWQSYRTTFTASPQWQTLYLPFAEFEPYRTGKALDITRLKRIGILAIGRAFDADLCIGRIGLYR
ncbi:MAG: CIA30 family protein [Gammaproteobacteria bacterium]